MARTFSVKNFARFQHYHDRSPPWIKLYNSLLDDYEFARLQDASKLHLISIWLVASRTNNKMPYDAGWLAGRINATARIDLAGLLKAGFIELNQESHETEQNASTLQAECLPRERERDRGEEEEESKTLAQNRRVNGTSPRQQSMVDESREADAEFERWYAAYPRHVAKAAGRNAYFRQRRHATAETLLNGVNAYAESVAGKEPQYIAHPATWLNGQRWADALNGHDVSEPRRPTTPAPFAPFANDRG